MKYIFSRRAVLFLTMAFGLGMAHYSTAAPAIDEANTPTIPWLNLRHTVMESAEEEWHHI